MVQCVITSLGWWMAYWYGSWVWLLCLKFCSKFNQTFDNKNSLINISNLSVFVSTCVCVFAFGDSSNSSHTQCEWSLDSCLQEHCQVAWPTNGLHGLLAGHMACRWNTLHGKGTCSQMVWCENYVCACGLLLRQVAHWQCYGLMEGCGASGWMCSLMARHLV